MREEGVAHVGETVAPADRDSEVAFGRRTIEPTPDLGTELRVPSGFAILMLAWTGCGGGADHALSPVSGRVTLRGKPLAGAHVMFQPVSAGSADSPGPGSFGHTDAQGRFELKTVGLEEPGAVVGKHRVKITRVLQTARQDDMGAPMDRSIPPAARNGQLEFEVPEGGTYQANFDL